MTLKHLFYLLSIAWALMWIATGLSIGSLMGDSVPQLLFFVGMAFVPPSLLFLLFFRAIPYIIRRFSKAVPHV
jgi:hypothetical protein